MSLAALAGALAIGLALGLLGSGGSILTVPVLVFLVGQDEKLAIAGSLLVVGVIALAGALYGLRARQADGRSVLWFGGAGAAGAALGAAVSAWIPGPVQLGIFALVMWLAAWTMLRRREPSAVDARPPRARRWLIADGLGVGGLTGLIGIGGGFLIVPALVGLGRLPMPRAIATSLWIIAINAFVGFAKHLMVLGPARTALDWKVLGTIAAIGAAGSIAGQRVGQRLDPVTLRRAFAVMLVLIGAAVLWRSLGRLLA
jgi:uncharacterized membrane protein YfcA